MKFEVDWVGFHWLGKEKELKRERKRERKKERERA